MGAEQRASPGARRLTEVSERARNFLEDRPPRTRLRLAKRPRGRISRRRCAFHEPAPFDRHLGQQAVDLTEAVIFLQADQAHAGHLEQRRDFLERDGAAAVDASGRILLNACVQRKSAHAHIA